jgi:hypothetical protein
MQNFKGILKSSFSDFIGIGASAVCTIHCVLLPLLASSLPVAGINIVENFWIETGLIGIALIVGVFSFYKSCFKKHKNKKPLLLFAVGFAFLLTNQIKENSLLVLTASILIILAHAWNYKLLRRYNSCSLKVI